MQKVKEALTGAAQHAGLNPYGLPQFDDPVAQLRKVAADLRSRGRVQDKVVIVTGAAAGVGEATVKKFAVEGAKVVCVDLPSHGQHLDTIVQQITGAGLQAMSCVADVSDEQQVQHMIQVTLTKYGRLDVMVPNAAQFLFTGEVQDQALEQMDLMLRNNCRSLTLCCKYALPELHKTHGNIVATGSVAGMIGQPMGVVYGATKGFFHQFIRGLAIEQAHYGVRANVIAPSPIDTAWTRKEPEGPGNAQFEKMLITASPYGRRGHPEEMANAIVWLASDEASFVNGAEIPVDGGFNVATGDVNAMVPNDIKQYPKSLVLPLTFQFAGQQGKNHTSAM